jgi:hypothetical protein
MLIEAGCKVSPGERVMANGADLVVGGGCPPHMVYVRVAPDVKARSRGWSQTWRSAFAQTVCRIRTDVTRCVLNGLPMICEARVVPLPAGAFIELHVVCSGTQIVIHVLDFVGPNDPGPDGGNWQPQPVDDTAHGAYGTAGELHLVPFYAPLSGDGPVDILHRLAANRSRTTVGSPKVHRPIPAGSRSKTMVWMPKEPTSAPAARTCEGRNGGHTVVSRNASMPAGGKLERSPAMRSRRSQPGSVGIADPCPAAPWIASGTPTLMPEKGICSAIRIFKSSRVIAAESPLRAHAGFNFDTSLFWSAIHSRPLPQQLRSDPVGLSPGRASEPQLR